MVIEKLPKKSTSVFMQSAFNREYNVRWVNAAVMDLNRLLATYARGDPAASSPLSITWWTGMGGSETESCHMEGGEWWRGEARISDEVWSGDWLWMEWHNYKQKRKEKYRWGWYTWPCGSLKSAQMTST